MKKIRMTFTGDVLPAYLPFYIKTGYLKPLYVNKDSKEPFDASISKVFEESDFNLINLESPLSRDLDYANEHAFIGHEIFAEYMNEIGITHVSLANNHMDEHGDQKIIETVGILNKNQITCCGINHDAKSKMIKISKNDVSIGIVSFNMIPTKNNSQMIMQYHEDEIRDLLDEMKGLDHKIVIAHWGNEYIHKPGALQRELGHKLIEMGFDLVIGHHPHVIQSYEDHEHGRIYYSLGNALFDDLFSKETRTGLMLDIEFYKDRIHYGQHILRLHRKMGSRIIKTPAIEKWVESILEDEDYYSDEDYTKEVAKERAKARFGMKRHLIGNILFNTSFKDKKQIIKNIGNYYRVYGK